jgi:AraC-like DNA-binding protein
MDKVFLKQVDKFLRSNIDKLHNNLKDQVESNFDISYESFRKKYRVVTGKTLKSSVKNIQLEVAEKLLLETDNSCIDIAKKIGFTNGASFSKWFKDLKGVKVNQFRNTNMDNQYEYPFWTTKMDN